MDANSLIFLSNPLLYTKANEAFLPPGLLSFPRKRFLFCPRWQAYKNFSLSSLQLHHEHIAVPPELVNMAGSHPVALYFQSSTFVAKTRSIQEVMWNISYQQIIHRMLRCFVFHIILTPDHTVPDMQLF